MRRLFTANPRASQCDDLPSRRPSERLRSSSRGRQVRGGLRPILIGWDAATVVFLTWVWATIGPMDARVRRRGRRLPKTTHAPRRTRPCSSAECRQPRSPVGLTLARGKQGQRRGRPASDHRRRAQHRPRLGRDPHDLHARLRRGSTTSRPWAASTSRASRTTATLPTWRSRSE